MKFMDLYRRSNSFFISLGKWDKAVHCALGCVIALVLLKVHVVLALLAPGLVGLGCEVLDKNFDGWDLLSWVIAGPLMVGVWYVV
jgi:hypothetical protein